jgi:hypothetical protein
MDELMHLQNLDKMDKKNLGGFSIKYGLNWVIFYFNLKFA